MHEPGIDGYGSTFFIQLKVSTVRSNAVSILQTAKKVWRMSTKPKVSPSTPLELCSS